MEGEEGISTGTPPRSSVTGTKWCLHSGVLTRERAVSQGTSWWGWRTGRQLSSVSVDLQYGLRRSHKPPLTPCPRENLLGYSETGP